MLALGLLLLVSAEQAGAAPVIGAEASVPLVNQRKLRDFVRDATRDDAVYLQDNRRNWYYAQLEGACPELRRTFSLGVKPGTGRLDRNAVLVVHGDYCAIGSLVHSAAPTVRPRTVR